MKAAIYTLGCKVNQTESEYICEILKKQGYEIVSPDEEADYYIINSCTVTSISDKKTRQSVRKFKRAHPNAAVILLGCFPQAFPQAAASLGGADIISGNKSCANVLRLINEYEKTGERIVDIEAHTNNETFAKCQINSFGGRIRAFVKIEDGCDRFCSYCIIPYSRGRVRSKPLAVLKDEANSLAANHVREIVLVGINLSAYGKGEDFDIADAVRVCAETKGILRVRLGSLEPDHMTGDILDRLSKIEKFCPQFHLSLQSGCANTLKNMNRHYTPGEYETLVNKIRSTFQGASITTDIMVGFNAESESDFAESAAFAEKIGFEKAHIFPYSERSGTLAVKMGGAIAKKEKEKRALEMKKVTDKSRHKFLDSLIGETVNVLFESGDGEVWRGYTKSYAPIKAQHAKNLIGLELDVKITAVDGDFCTGTVIDV
ncbi:MAG: tRNA (N(6)-L-threonylcarbamoyladenosine(37)-C(2))-methylthiotransferase MtaB [Clostridiales bacterium]|nr:tRNA (N(6)-L-threonylcarbamoyladenosine(37)-C(2))-methylthiotransferase MtaB [Clostridiales bacterium]